MIIVIDRPYGGAEGHRIRAGTIFWCGAPADRPEHVPATNVITADRAAQLINGRLAHYVDGEGNNIPPERRGPVAPARRTQDVPPKPRRRIPEEKNPPEPIATVKDSGKKSRGLRVKTDKAAPPPERQVKKPSQSGGQTGKAASPSASPAAPQTKESTSEPLRPKRGQRSGGSPLTTDSNSRPGATFSTPLTANGGTSTGPASPDPDPDPALS